MFLPDGGGIGEVEDCFVAVQHTLFQLIGELSEAEYLQPIAGLDLADSVGDEAMMNVVVAGLK